MRYESSDRTTFRYNDAITTGWMRENVETPARTRDLLLCGRGCFSVRKILRFGVWSKETSVGSQKPSRRRKREGEKTNKVYGKI